MKKEVVLHSDPKAPISESFRTLRTNIQFMNTNKQMQTLLITSTLPGEGKSLITANLAVTFAQTGKKVVLIDADMRKGRQYDIFDIPSKPGLSNYLSGIDEKNMPIKENDLFHCIHRTETRNLFIMSSGSIPPNPSELLVSTQMADLLNELKTIFDIIIIDGTPSAVVTDSVILSRIVDATVIVASYKQTRKDNLERIVKNIQNVGGKITGIVLNKVPITGKSYEQSYYYGHTESLVPQEKNKKKKRKHGKEKEEPMINIPNETMIEEKGPSKEEIEQEIELMRLKLQNKELNEELQKKTTPKKGRGRPRKNPLFIEPVEKKKRGRPRKNPEETINYKKVKDERTRDILEQMNAFMENKDQ